MSLVLFDISPYLLSGNILLVFFSFDQKGGTT